MTRKLRKPISLVLSLIIAVSAAISGIAAITVSARVPDTAMIVHIPDDGTRDVDFNEDWQFYLATRTPSLAGGSGSSGFAQYGLADAGDYTTEEIIDASFDDSGWRTLTVPHDFSIEGEKVPQSEGGNSSQGYLLGGLGWYRKTFTVPQSMRTDGKRITIDFEGVYQNSIVYLNGREIGNYPSGYTGFAYDITDALNYGEDNPNVLVVKVQNMAPSGRWYTGSGIVRPVHLIVTDPVRITRNGVTLSTPNLETTYKNNGSARLNVNVDIYSNQSNGVFQLKTTVIDADGNTAAAQETDLISINPTTGTTVNSAVTVPNVNLWYPWNIGDPYLYTVRTEICFQQDGTNTLDVVDSIDTKFGFRWFKVDAYDADNADSGGLHVNDVYTKVQGVDLHHDSGALGAVSNKDAYERQIEKLMSMGVNAYRTSHCPPSKAIIEVCSEKGLIVAEEAYDGWGGTKATYDFGSFFWLTIPDSWAGFFPNGLTSAPSPAVNYSGAEYTWSDWVVHEMVSRDINEASVMMWSVGNEMRGLGTQPSWYQPAQYDKLGVGETSLSMYTESVRLAETMKELDANRLVIVGTDSVRTPAQYDSTWGYVARYLDGFGLNYNTAASVDVLMDRFSPTFYFESESSSQTSSRGVYLDPSIRNTGINQTPGRRGGSNYDNDFASWTMSNEYGLKKDRDRKGFIGQFIWTGFDYIGEPTPYSVYPVGVSSFATIDTAGFPKDSYFLYRSQWTDSETDPLVHVLPGNWNEWREGEEVEVWVNANVQTVDLRLNGESLGIKSLDVKATADGREYLETSEYFDDDKSWGDDANPSGYTSPGATIVSASGDSEIAEGSNFGRLHLTWMVPYEAGTLEAWAYENPEDPENGVAPVAIDVVKTSGTPYTIEMDTWREVIKADGNSLTYVECTIVDEDGNPVPNANNLVKFDVTGGAIVGVDNGQQESAELYKWENVERNAHSERSAYMGKVLVILQSNKGETGRMTLTVSSDDLQSAQMNIAVTEDGKGSAPSQPVINPTFSSIDTVKITAPYGAIPTLPANVRVNYTDNAVGEYSILKSVVWEPINTAIPESGIVTVTGTVDGLSVLANAVIHFVEADEAADIALNEDLGTNNQIFSFADIDQYSDLRSGALATASFTGSTSRYPNNMINGDMTSSWSNAYSRGASVLLPAYTASRPYEYVEFFWDSTRIFNQIELYFTVDSNEKLALPAALNVQYWDGQAWIDASDQMVSKAAVSNEATIIDFAVVSSDRVRVGMENATPYSDDDGNIQIVKASVMGWVLNQPEQTVESVAASLTIQQPAQDDTQIIMPEVPEGFAIALTASGNENLIALNGTIAPPSEETLVDLTFTVSKDGASATRVLTVIVPKKSETVGPADPLITFMLESTIQYAEDAIENGELEHVIETVLEEFHGALAQAREVLENAQSASPTVTQDDVDQATRRLVRAVQFLEFKGDKTALAKLIAMAEEYIEHKDEYIPSSYIPFETELEASYAVMDDKDALNDEIQETMDKLWSAVLGLRFKPNKDKLAELLREAEAVNISLYTVGSVQVLQEAVNLGTTVMNDDEVEQDEVNHAVEVLSSALDGLKLLPTSGGSGSGSGSESSTSGGSSDADSGTGGAQHTTGTSIPKTADPANAAGLLLLLLASSAIAIVSKKLSKKEN